MPSRQADWGARTRKKTAGTTVKLDDRVAIEAAPDQAWTRLSDVPFVASCLPGLVPGSLEALDDRRFRARMVHSVMGVDATWDLDATINPFPADRRLEVLLAGKESRLSMTMDGNARVALSPDEPSGSVLDYTADIRVAGSLAAMGGPVIRSVMGDALAGFVAAVGGQEVQARPKGGRLRQALRRLLDRLLRRTR
jgi:carbon monoxide dehydrogenase subunit G